MILLAKLLLAHLTVDFVFQSDAWIRERELKKHRSPKLYLHVLLHGALTWLLVWDIAFWLPIVVIVVSHYLIDLAKAIFQREDTRIRWFVLDQTLHLIVLFLVWTSWSKPDLSLAGFPIEDALILITAAVFLTNPTSVIIKTIISQWAPDTFYAVSTSLPDAGKYIGLLERLLVLMFILAGHWQAVGFLLAAKSVFRFGNLKESHDRKLTEYVLIGTLLSFGIALAVSFAASFILGIRSIDNSL